MEKEVQEVKKCPISWWKRIGYMGFWFFLFKGIAWLIGLGAIYIWGPEIFTDIQNFILGK